MEQGKLMGMWREERLEWYAGARLSTNLRELRHESGSKHKPGTFLFVCFPWALLHPLGSLNMGLQA